jgi:putative Mg2+ transporter-C (MgtC) family protein
MRGRRIGRQAQYSRRSSKMQEVYEKSIIKKFIYCDSVTEPMAGMAFTAFDLSFVWKLVFCMVAGYLIGTERELRGKAAGVSTHAYVIGGAMLFTIISGLADPSSPARVTAQIVTGIGFLGAGIILKDEGGKITNLTTAASIWFSASLGVAIGMEFYVIAAIALVFSLVVPRLPHLSLHMHHDK